MAVRLFQVRVATTGKAWLETVDSLAGGTSQDGTTRRLVRVNIWSTISGFTRVTLPTCLCSFRSAWKIDRSVRASLIVRELSSQLRSSGVISFPASRSRNARLAVRPLPSTRQATLLPTWSDVAPSLQTWSLQSYRESRQRCSPLRESNAACFVCGRLIITSTVKIHLGPIQHMAIGG